MILERSDTGKKTTSSGYMVMPNKESIKPSLSVVVYPTRRLYTKVKTLAKFVTMRIISKHNCQAQCSVRTFNVPRPRLAATLLRPYSVGYIGVV